jgi:predicted phosphodiesterase
MKFQLLSDLHTEFVPFALKKADDCEFLILAGDIAHAESAAYEKLLLDASEKFEKVFVVAGNHECYGHTVQKAMEILSGVCAKFANVFFLNNDAVDLGEDVRVVGTTLWSDIQEEQMSDVRNFLSDFRHIKEWTVETNNSKHRKAVEFLRREILRASADGKRLVVVTHHAPYERRTSNPKYAGSSLSSAFATDLSDLLREPVAIWAFGHTHYTSRQVVGGVQLVSNQRGYAHIGEQTGFEEGFAFEL